MKTLVYLFSVAALSTAVLSATTNDVFFDIAVKQIKKGNSQYFKALGAFGKMKPEFMVSPETKGQLLVVAQKEVALQNAAQGEFTLSTLGKWELALTVSAGMWLAAKTWQSINYTPKEVKYTADEVNKIQAAQQGQPAQQAPNTAANVAAGEVKTFWQRTVSQIIDAGADWSLLSSNAVLAGWEFYKAGTALTKKKEALKNAELVLAAVEKLPVGLPMLPAEVTTGFPVDESAIGQQVEEATAFGEQVLPVEAEETMIS